VKDQVSLIREEMEAVADSEKARLLARFFKTGKGEYGEGDTFLGIMVPGQRRIAKRYAALPLSGIRALLSSRFHEHRLVALFILTARFRNADETERQTVFDFYLSQTKHINNWDLVDLSAGYILGGHLLDKDRSVLYRLARSRNLWERRMAIIATSAFIRNGEFDDTLRIAEILLADAHDLIHKAVGWMLREVGKRDLKTEETFLRKHYRTMPRTMLRYAIERFEEKKRKAYLKK
jgi:3-methyladenine DNA glycosylase AlkD